MAGFTIRNEVGATVFAILSGLSILFFTAWVFSPGGCARPEGPAIPPVPVADAGGTDAAGSGTDADSDLEAESSRRADLALSLRESEEALAELEKENQALLNAQKDSTAELEEWNSLLSSEDGAETNVASILAKLTALEAQNENLKALLAEAPEADLEAL
ncbi:MAG: hypothetical protein AAGF67_16505, partial [Verrucomicrobiota bacterium]